MARVMAMNSASRVSSIVAGSRDQKTSSASSPGSTLVEMPKLPWTARSMNFRYCTDRGWSSPKAASRASRRSVVCRSPRIAETGTPGSERSQPNTSIESTRTTRIIWISRRRTKRSMDLLPRLRCPGAVVHDDPRTRRRSVSDEWESLSSDRHRVELLGRERAGDHALHAGSDDQGGGRVADRQAGKVLLHDLAVDLLERRAPLGLVDGRVGRLEVVDQLLAPRHDVGAEVVVLQVAEERADEVVGRVVVTGPAQDVGVVLAGLTGHVVEVATVPGGRRHLHLDADRLEVGAQRLVDLLRVRHVGPGDLRGVCELERHALRSGLGEQPLGLVGVVGVGLDAGVVATDRVGHELRRDRRTLRQLALDELLAVEGVVDRLPHLEVLELRIGLGVEPEVEDVERVTHLDAVALLLETGPVDRVGEVVAVDAAGLELLAPGALVGDHPEDDLAGQGLLAPVV